MKHKSIGQQITTVETTNDKIIGWDGITFIQRYLEKIKLFYRQTVWRGVGKQEE